MQICHENSGMGTTAITFASMFGHTKIVEYLNKQDKNRSFKYKNISTFIENLYRYLKRINNIRFINFITN